MAVNGLLHGWVPYEERGAYLLDGDPAVSAHHDQLEWRISFRTRKLDRWFVSRAVRGRRGHPGR
jgi:hypothetical protein